jgi:hypothetical protein
MIGRKKTGLIYIYIVADSWPGNIRQIGRDVIELVVLTIECFDFQTRIGFGLTTESDSLFKLYSFIFLINLNLFTNYLINLIIQYIK